MKSFENFKNSNFEYLKNAIEIWKKDERGLEDIHVKNHINNASHALDNLDEYTKNEIARFAVISTEPFSGYAYAIDRFEINKEEDAEIYNSLSEVVTETASINSTRDKFIQAIANYYGIEIPLLEDVENERIKYNILDNEYGDLRYDNPNYEVELKLLELEEQLKIDETALGQSNSTISGGFVFKQDVINKYAKRKEDLEKKYSKLNKEKNNMYM